MFVHSWIIFLNSNFLTFYKISIHRAYHLTWWLQNWFAWSLIENSSFYCLFTVIGLVSDDAKVFQKILNGFMESNLKSNSQRYTSCLNEIAETTFMTRLKGVQGLFNEEDLTNRFWPSVLKTFILSESGAAFNNPRNSDLAKNLEVPKFHKNTDLWLCCLCYSIWLSIQVRA